MSTNVLSVRELREKDIEFIIQYWLGSGSAFLQGMGVDISKVPNREQWTSMLSEQLSQSPEEKGSCCFIWLVDNKPVGHSNVNKIIFGEEAYMHLHLWSTEVRQKGIGSTLVKMTLPYFFKTLKLKRLFCEPYALNISPNKTLEKVGFQFVKKHTTIPGWLNFEQEVNLWELSYDRFKELK